MPNKNEATTLLMFNVTLLNVTLLYHKCFPQISERRISHCIGGCIGVVVADVDTGVIAVVV